MRKKVVILGAAGRDFHEFLTFFKRHPHFDVIAFTAEQIPGIAGRRFPTELAGKRYPDGIPIVPESTLPQLIEDESIDYVCLAYSDLSHQTVMEKASLVLACGAQFLLVGARDTYVASQLPVIAVTAVRTGCGKSQTARALAEILRARGKRVVGIRHSMPYGKDLRIQDCQRFATAEDFADHHTTIEEEEEYQPWLDHGFVIYAGFDYRKIVSQAEKEADILIFDGGNNDVSMVRPDLQITVVDPHRAGHELEYFPGLVNLITADVIVINKVDSATQEAVAQVTRNLKQFNKGATIIKARSELVVDRPDLIKRKRCCVIGDGPTLTHGGMSFGAGTLAVKKYGGRIANPHDALKGDLRKTYAKFPHLDREIPAMGYSAKQVRDLQRTVAGVECDVIVDGSPANLQRIIRFEKPVVSVGYELGSRAVGALERELQRHNIL
jgi:predicted GTPase